MSDIICQYCGSDDNLIEWGDGSYLCGSCLEQHDEDDSESELLN